MIIGNKNVFGFEYKIINSRLFYGNGRIWFGGNPIGAFEDETHLIHIVNGLKRIQDSKILNIDNDISINELFNQLMKRTENIYDDEIHDFIINFGTSTDDFIVFSYSSSSHIHILWRIINYKSVFDDINNLSKSVNYFKIERVEYNIIMSSIVKMVR